MACILFYSPFNQRSRDTESLMIAFHRQGHSVISLSQQEGHVINEFLVSNGISAYSYVLPGKRFGGWYFLRHLLFFVIFCWKHKVDIVYSHLEPANFVASMGQYLIRGKTYLCRHHIDEALLYKFNTDFYYRTTYRLAKRIIVVSNGAKEYMIKYEHIPAKKIIHINLAYDFSLYQKADNAKIDMIRKEYSADILMLSVCRLTKYKRPDMAIKTIKELADRGLNAKLILLGKGELQSQLEALITEMNLKSKVFMPGYVDNVMDFMAASDYLLHPSLLDSSCVAVKEAGLVEVPVIVCKGVGDFDDYIVNKENGFLVNPEKFVSESVQMILESYEKKSLLKSIGGNLRKSVIEHFSIESVINKYDSLNNLS